MRQIPLSIDRIDTDRVTSFVRCEENTIIAVLSQQVAVCMLPTGSLVIGTALPSDKI
jgi:hypothetical protein